jgi:hypothetical protein
MSGQGIEKMKLEVGKKYLNREGQVIKIIDFSPSSLHYKYSDGIDTFTEDGFQWRDRQHSPNDLVSEYTEDKVFKIEVGKRYTSRDGSWVSGPVEKHPSQDGYRAKFFRLDDGTENNEMFYEHQSGYWWFSEEGSFNVPSNKNPYDLVKEYTEEKIFKVEAGKRYYTRNGGITEAVNIDDESSQPFTAKVYNKDNRYQGFKWFNENGHWLKERGESEWDLVKEYEEKKTLTLPLQVGKKYLTKGSKVVEATKLDKDINIRLGNYWYDTKTGKFLGYENDDDYEDHIVSDYIEDSSELPKPEAKQEKKKPIKYSDLTFYEAWSLAKETKKRYRLKGSEWLEFPNVKVNKETFAKIEWEVEK